MNFVAIDVETANADYSSICQIGLATVQNGKIENVWSSLVDPEDFFSDININIHGINEEMVQGSPTFSEIYPELSSMIVNSVVVSHTNFDRVAITRAIEKNALSAIELTWLDSARVSRRAWPEKYAKQGYGLANIAQDLGITFNHHDAAEDARVAAEVMLRAIETSSLNIEEWLQRTKQPIMSRKTCEVNSEGPLFGEVIVFTGQLDLPRFDATYLAMSAGCIVADGVTKKTSLLVVGDQDIQRLAGHEKSSKQEKAEDLIAKGQNIRILSESDFKTLLKPAETV